MNDDLVFISLILLLIAQNIYWAKICYDLNNRLMSRNYYDYSQAQALKAPSVPQHQLAVELDTDAERQAQNANVLMGMV